MLTFSCPATVCAGIDGQAVDELIGADGVFA